MTDIIKSENNVPIRFADMGDGTYAEVTATNLFSSGANFNVIGDGKSLTSTGTSVSTLIPFDSTSLLAAGSVRVAVTDPGYIRIESTEAAASATDILVNPEDSILINTEGKRFISFVSLVGEATANIQPVGNNSFKMFESSLDLNFLSNEYVFNNDFVSFSSIATFSRNSAATFVGSNGLIQYAPANTPRFDYDPVTLQPRGLLIEEQRTNLLTFSEQFENAVWSKIAVVTTANQSVSPNGSINAYKVAADTTNQEHFIEQGFSVTAGTVYSASCYIKNDGATDVTIRYVVAGLWPNGVSPIVRLNFATGQVSVIQGSPSSFSAVLLPNGFWLLSMSVVCAVSGGAIFRIAQFSGSNATFSGNNTDGFFVWGGQVEAGAFPTSYIPTTTAQATRLADIANIDGANFAAFYNQSEGTIMTEFLPQQVVSARLVCFDAGSISNQIDITTTGVGTVAIESVSSGVFGGSVATTAAITINAVQKCAASFSKTQSEAISLNGSPPISGNIANVTMNLFRILIGRQENGASTLNGHIRRIMYIPKRLSNTELQALTI